MRAGTLVKGLFTDSDAVIRYYRCLENSGRQRGDARPNTFWILIITRSK
jgi:hypothetical protein